MKFPYLSRPRRDDTISTLYGAIVAQARAPVLYRVYQVPDSVNGRLDMVMLHLFAVYRRLARETPQMQALGQGLFDYFCADMDGNLREMGIGDLKVPKQMRGIGAAFYGRASAYEQALAATEEGALETVLRRNVFEGVDVNDREISVMSSYIRKMIEVVEETPLECFATGEARFPDPSAIAGGAVDPDGVRAGRAS